MCKHYKYVVGALWTGWTLYAFTLAIYFSLSCICSGHLQVKTKGPIDKWLKVWEVVKQQPSGGSVIGCSSYDSSAAAAATYKCLGDDGAMCNLIHLCWLNLLRQDCTCRNGTASLWRPHEITGRDHKDQSFMFSFPLVSNVFLSLCSQDLRSLLDENLRTKTLLIKWAQVISSSKFITVVNKILWCARTL